MNDRTGNFQKDIHDREYEAAYLAHHVQADSLLSISGRSTQTLSGSWHFAADWYDSCRRAGWFKEIVEDGDGRTVPVDWDWESFDSLPVPGCWNLARPELHYFEGSGLYTRSFAYRAELEGERVFLRFEGVQYRCTVFLNGECMAYHDGGSTPFNVEVTGKLLGENRLIVVVEAHRRPERVPAENTDWFNYGGIYRDVFLVRLPPVFIRRSFVRLTSGRLDEISIDLEVDGAGEAEVELGIPELGVLRRLTVSEGRARVRFAAHPELWSPRHPRLYDVELVLGEDRLRERIGFREIRVEAGELLLNGEPIFLKGICLHEDHPLTGKTTDETAIRGAIAHVKELHGNYLRLAHYPHDERFARIADEEGLLLWEELPVYWAIDFANPGTYADAENQLAELILRDRNRASVIVWSVGNENADTDQRLSFMSRLAAMARALDGSRLVSAACLVDHHALKIDDRLADCLDIVGINEYYGWYDPDFSKLSALLANSEPGKPVVICEFGADARSGEHGGAGELWTEEYQAALYEKQIAVLRDCPYIKGITPWILYDFRCPRRLNAHQGGFNRKGLVDANRVTKKLAFEVLARFYAEIP